ncbi:MAG: MFS transporter [Desulfotalea sp.]
MNNYYQFLTKNKAILLLGFFTIFWGNWGQSFFISWFGASLQKSLNLSAGEYGLSYSIATLSSSVCLVWLGGLLDRVDLRKYIFCIACGLCLACFLMSQASGFYSLIVAFFFLRLCGQGLMPHTGQTIMVKYFGEDRGKALGVASSGVPVGEIILPVFAVWLLATYGLHNSWLIIGGMTVVLFIPLVMILLTNLKNKSCLDANGLVVEYKEELVDSISSATKIEYDRAAVLKDKRFWFILPAVLVPAFVLTGIFIHQGSLLAEKGWSSNLFASSFVVYGIVHWLSSVSIGPVVDTFSGRKMVGFYLLPALVGMIFLSQYNQPWVVMVFMVSLGVSIGISTPIIGALWAELYGTSEMGSIRSFLIALMVFSSSLSPVIFGYLLDGGWSFSTILIITSAVTSLTMLMSSYGASEKFK